MSKKAEWSMSYSWTQPYQDMNCREIYNSLELDAIDRIVESMSTYPDAERIINKIIGDMKND
jgi:hypothetical protein